jgi:hypothetical protein
VKIFRWVVIAWTICITLLVGFAVLIKNPRSMTETRTFCAYGRIFVEFEDSDRVWGTLMLDFYGRPIPCTEGIEPETNNTI